ncbi:hypothetical protein L6261_04295 [Candidatus Parcubacteria bacterium]|nr:hypothetical protein [Candidatus Parcubacteria bacterium]
MSSILKNKITSLFIFSALFFPVFANAGIETSIDVKIQPESPKANEYISVSIESYSMDLNQSKISWYKNNILEKSGVGEKTFSFQTGKLGGSDTIVAKINSSQLGTITKTIIIRPAEVDLIWETDSITPPLYKGKTLSSFQAKTKVIAVPNIIDTNGKLISSENLIYKWKKDWKVLGSKSGYGKNSLILEDFDSIKDVLIGVEIETSDGKFKANNNILIKTYQPKVILYENNPLLGVVYDNAISNNLNLKEQEISLVAVPFFFSKNSKIQYSWFMNDKKIDNETNSLILRQNEGDTGSSSLRLNIQNLDKIMQSAQNKLNIIFGEV